MGLIDGDYPLLPTPGIHDHHNMKRTLPVDREQQLLKNVWLECGLFDDFGRVESQF